MPIIRKVTKEEITVSCTIILTLEGINFRKAAIIILDIHKTNVRASVITNACSSLTVTANAEHIPNTWVVIGFDSINGSENICFLSDIYWLTLKFLI